MEPASPRANDLASTSLQIAAAYLLRQVIDHGRSLDQVLAEQEKRVQPAQVATLREIGFGGCRYYDYLDGVISRFVTKPIRSKDRIVHFLLVTGLYQIMYMRIPDHAAVHQTVAALKSTRQPWAQGLVNGVLRGYLRARDSKEFDSFGQQLTPAQRVSIPGHMYQWIREAWPEHCEAICSAFLEHPPLTLRVNRRKVDRDEYLSLLGQQGIDARITKESPVGITLAVPRGVDDIPRFAEGWVSVQDESAQLSTDAMDLQAGMRVLDACAAPGGKTCAMLESEPSIQLTAVDLPERMESIRQNLRRLGLHARLLDNGLEALVDDREGGPWDRILLDVPCTGTGVIRRHPDIRHRRQPGDPERFAEQQRTLLDLAWQVLVPGGLLLYVTCSILPLENDSVIGGFLNRRQDVRLLPLNISDGLKTRYGIQRLPGVHTGDGFFFCCLAKL